MLLLALTALVATYLSSYFITTTIEDRKTAGKVYGGLAGKRFIRHFRTETHFFVFLPLFWCESYVRGKSLDPNIESGRYNRVIFFLPSTSSY